MKNKHPDWALRHKKPGTELRNINGRYYLYEIRSVWDKEKKRAKKKTGKCLGAITPEGFKPSKKTITAKTLDHNIVVKSYGGFAWFIEEFQDWLDPFKKSFPDYWEELFTIVHLRLFHRSKTSQMPFYFINSFISEYFYEIDLTEATVRNVLKRLVQAESAVDSYLKYFLGNKNIALLAGSSEIIKKENL